MTHLKFRGDQRLTDYCTYCMGENESRDHVPSKVLLDEPYPSGLAHVPCCLECNNGFSADEEYFACLIECIISGSTDPEKLSREKIKNILLKKPSLQRELTQAMIEDNGSIVFSFHESKVENVLRKLALGHMKYENGDTPFSEQMDVTFAPIHLLSSDDKIIFFQAQQILLPEVGSRGLQRILGTGTEGFSHWIHVQKDVYSYSVTNSSVRMLISNYLACEVTWD